MTDTQFPNAHEIHHSHGRIQSICFKRHTVLHTTPSQLEAKCGAIERTGIEMVFA